MGILLLLLGCDQEPITLLDAPHLPTTSVVIVNSKTTGTSLRLTAYDGQGQVVFGPATEPTSPTVQMLGLPVSTARIQLENLERSSVAGLWSQDVALSPGQPHRVEDPEFQPVREVLEGIALEPAGFTLAPGTRSRLRAIGRFQDGSVADISGSVEWSVPGQNVSVSDLGQVEAIQPGSELVRVSLGDLSTTTQVVVSDTTLDSLQIENSRTELTEGEALEPRVAALYSDGSQQDITEQATLLVDGRNVMEVEKGGAVRARAPGSSVVTATFGGQTAQTQIDVRAAALRSLVSISVSPTRATLSQGTSTQFRATGIYSDRTTSDLTRVVTWTTASSAICTVTSQGLARGVKAGNTTLRAAYAGKAGSASVTVTAPTLSSLSLTAGGSLPLGLTQQLKLTARYSNGTTSDVTNSSTFRSANSSCASVGTMSPTRGLVKALKVGQSAITATYQGKTAQTSVTVTPAVISSLALSPASLQLPVGQAQQLAATARYSDGSNRTVTSSATFSSNAAAKASVSTLAPRGVVTARTQGSALITASFSGKSATCSVAVVPAVLQRIELSAQSSTIPLGLSLPVVATGFYSDGIARPLTGLVWTVSNSNAVVDPFGQVSTRAKGQLVVTAARGNLRGTLSLTVTDARLESLAVQPDMISLPLGLTGTLSAVGLYSDGSSRDLTSEAGWISTEHLVAEVGNGGEAGRITTLKAGQTLVKASVSGKTATATVRVDSAVLAAIELQVAPGNLPVGLSRQVQAYGRMTDGTVLLLEDAFWESANPELAVVDQDGTVTAKKTGEVVIRASRSGVVGSTTVSLSAAVLQELTASPSSVSTFVGNTANLTATGLYSDGTQQDMTSTVSWQSSDTDVASVDNLDQLGLLTAHSTGTVTVTATSGDIAREIAVEVQPLVLQRLEIAPESTSLPKGASIDYQAYGFFNDDSKRDITNDVTWSSSQSAIAAITTLPTAPDDVKGRAVAKAVGQTEITARMAGTEVSASSPLTVTSAVIVSLAFDNPETVIPRGSGIYFRAMATYSDQSVKVLNTGLSYSTSDSGVGMVTPIGSWAGAFRAYNSGLVTVFARHDASGLSVSRALTVTDTTLWKLSFLPQSLRAPLGYTTPYRLYATYLDGRRVDITSAPISYSWNASSYDGYSPFDEFDGVNGLFTPRFSRLKRPRVNVTYGGKSESVPDIVHGDVSESLTVSSTISDVPVGRQLPLRANGVFTDPARATFDITRNVNWSSSNPAVATVSNALNSEGVVTGVSAGQAVITANNRGRTANFTVTVTAATLTSVRIKEGPTAVEKRYERRFYVEGVFDDGTRRDLGSQVSWSVSEPNLATISNSANTRGILVGNQTGLVTVTMRDSVSGLTDSARLTILDSPIRQISPLKGKLVEMRLSPSGNVMYCLEKDALRGYQLPGWDLLLEVPFSDGLAMDLSADGDRVVVTRSGRIASVVNTETSAVTSLSLPGDVTENLSDVDIGTDGLAYTTSVRYLHVIDLDSGTAESQLYPYPGYGGGVIAKVDETNLLLTVRPGVSPPTITRHRLENGLLVLEESLRYGGSARSLTVSPDKNSFLFVRPETTGGRSHFKTRDFSSAFPAMVFDSGNNVASDYCYSRSGAYIFAAPSSTSEDRMLVFEGETGRPIVSLPIDSRRGYLSPVELELSPDGRFLYTAMSESTAAYTELLTIQVEE